MWDTNFIFKRDPSTGEQSLALQRDFDAIEVELLEHMTLWDETGDVEGLEHA